jgi:hypothetical protein
VTFSTENRGHRDDGWGGRLGPGTIGDVRVQHARSTQGMPSTQSSQPPRTVSKTRGAGPTGMGTTNNSQTRRQESHNGGSTQSRTSSLAGGKSSDQQTKLTDWYTSTEAERERIQMDRDLYGGSTQSTQLTQNTR